MSDPERSQFTAHEMGWMRRSDVGPRVWEMPNGAIYLHCDTTLPVITKQRGGWSVGMGRCNDDRSGR